MRGARRRRARRARRLGRACPSPAAPRSTFSYSGHSLPRPDEGLVVEARRRERPAELVGHLHQVALERADEVLARDDRALARPASTQTRTFGIAVDRHLAVRAVARAAEEPARPVVLEAAREDRCARRVERRADRVAGERLDALSVEEERELRASGRSARRAASRRAGVTRGLRMPRARDLVRVRVPLGEEPLLAHAAEPPLALDAPRRCRGSRRTRSAPLSRRRRRGRLVDSPAQRSSSTSRGPQFGQVTSSDIVYVRTERNGISPCATLTYRRGPHRSTVRAAASRPRSGRWRSSTRSPTAASSGTNELARRTGLPPSTVSRQLGHARATGLVEHDAETRPLPARRSAIVRLANAVLGTARRPRGRPPAPRGARPDHRRDGDAPRPGRGGRDHRRLRARAPTTSST